MIVQPRGQKDRAVRLREIRKRRRKIFLIIVAVVAVISVSALAWHTHAAERRIRGVVVRGSTLVDESVVRGAAEQVLDGSTLLIFSNRYPWLAPLSRVKNTVEQIPSVASANVRIADGDVIEVTLVERTPVAIGCSPTCMLVDERGIGIGDPSRATTTYARIELSENIERGFNEIVPPHILVPARAFLAGMNASNFSYASVRVLDEQQLEAHGPNLPMVKVAFATIDGAAARIATAIHAGELRADLSGIEYVDARFERSVSYLPKSSTSNEMVSDSGDATASTTPSSN
jgi:hypothetical protein